MKVRHQIVADFEIATRLRKQGNVAAAINILQKIIDVHRPKIPHPYLGLILGLIQCMVNLGDIEGAEQTKDLFEQVNLDNAKLTPDSRAYLSLVAKAVLDEKKLVSLNECLEKNIDLNNIPSEIVASFPMG